MAKYGSFFRLKHYSRLRGLCLQGTAFPAARPPFFIWAFEPDEGCEPGMYADDTMPGLIGLIIPRPHQSETV